MKTRILIVEDQSVEANNLKIILQKAGYHVCSIAISVAQALVILENEKPDLALLDIQLKGNQTGIDLAHMLAARNIAFIFLSANSDAATLKLAKESCPYGFLLKPFRQKEVLVMMDVAFYLHQQKQEQSLTAPRRQPARTKPGYENILGESAAMKSVFSQLEIVSQTDTSVLILGESGTGKELIANAIHRLSKRSHKPFVIVNCGTLPANLIESQLFGHEKGAFTGAYEKQIGKFEQADGGTIFLDEVGELPVDLQVKFLRVLQEREIEPIGGKRKPIHVRVIAATNRNLEEEMAAGRFRMDLYYRLNIFPIHMPPLRERREDIIALAEHFVAQLAARERKHIEGLSDAAKESLLSYHWPGNIRELQNMMERSVLLCTSTLIPSIPLAATHSSRIKSSDTLKTFSENERDHILAVLEKTQWKIFGPGGAAELLELNGSTLQSKMKKLGIEKRITQK
ncbi:two component, sigma54 specific, transcriptional regulator, Fis family [Filimonas lacunae]|uniref:Two component, sigma54 specific, transcriptional regulator, Fis family n=1 Tax=Filimonas lacunae TaxID=477680 RepID=A0A173MH40_9BACT|nr:sigma-54 dependent transcriptional regulator [Filimonas lacunae]BAV06923.1 formate hydrogenlyase transcriptional activator [Filimonas lacunae]SIS97781.1 two component, sigma54 specific, transcriptional regulator, Fis family [Filimonas lacunae]